jgi:hypothetical protein
MDCSSFPKMLQFKRKILPHPQLLRLAEWFPKYTFTVEHIKGTKNLIPDMLTRPPKTQTLLLPLILIASFSNLAPPDQDFPTDDLPPLAQEMVLNHTLDLQAKDKLFSLQDYLLLNYNMSSFCFQSLGIHPKYPFIHLFTFKPSGLFPKELYFFLWYFCHLYHIAIEFPTDCFLSSLLRTSWPADSWYYTLKFLTWFHNPTQWISLLQHKKSKWPHPQPCWIEVHRNASQNKSVKQAFAHLFLIFIFHRPFKASTDNLVMSFPQATVYKSHLYSLYEHLLDNLPELRTLQKTVCLKNNIIPDEIWLKGTDPDEEIDYNLYDPQYSAHLYDLQMQYKNKKTQADNLLLEPHEMEMVADDDYVLSLQVQTTRDQDNLSYQNLSPDHEPIVG